MSKKTHVFISHISEELIEANRAKDYLEQVFPDQLEVFVASSWTSIQPGDDWFARVAEAIENADIMIVFCSGDSVARAWIQFETGAGWFAKKTAVIPICHKGMTPAALPEPIRRLQAVDINAESETDRLKKLAEAIRTVANLPEPSPISVESLALSDKSGPMSSLKGWILRPAAHINDTLGGVFKVGTIGAADIARAKAAGLDPNDAIYIRLYVEPPNGQYVNAMAQGKVASFFESEGVETAVVIARLRLAASFQGNEADDRSVPIIVVEDAKRRP